MIPLDANNADWWGVSILWMVLEGVFGPGDILIMGDSDDSYDFLELPRFVSELRKGHDLVQGCRFPSRGGTILPG
jgi:hypothetical protein